MNPAKLTFDPSEFLRRYDALDRALVAKGWHATSPWWRKEIERFFLSGKRRWVIRAGRRSGKSSTLCRVAVAWALWGAYTVPQGDVGVVPFLSVDRDEAGGRIRTIGAILRVLDVPHDAGSDQIELFNQRLVFRVTTASIRSVGFMAVLLVGDEMSRWESREHSANPAAEVMASVRPTMATQPFAFEICASSPWGTDDLHAELFEQGNNDQQIVSFSPTWVANPSITEARTHELEPDERIWSREYAGEPGAQVSNAFDPVDAAACFGRPLRGGLGQGFVAIDASAMRHDAFCWIAGRETEDGGLHVRECGGWEGAELRSTPVEDVVARISAKATEYGTGIVFGDHYERLGLGALFAAKEKVLHVYTWTDKSKDESVVALKRLMREGRLSLPSHATLRTQTLGLKARLMPSNRVRYDSNGKDFVSALLTLGHALAERRVGAIEQRLGDGFWAPWNGARAAHQDRLDRTDAILFSPSASPARDFGGASDQFAQMGCSRTTLHDASQPNGGREDGSGNPWNF